MSELTIRTDKACWVVPENVEIVKMMIIQRCFRASELCFLSDQECQHFVKRLSLLALADECAHSSPSIIAKLSRRLIAQQSSQPI